MSAMSKIDAAIQDPNLSIIIIPKELLDNMLNPLYTMKKGEREIILQACLEASGREPNERNI